jgi:hypothetical protein
VIKYSPDGRSLAVVTERGRLDLNAPEDTIWVFRIADEQRFVQHPDTGNAPIALPLAQMATDKDGPLIEQVRWLTVDEHQAGGRQPAKSQVHRMPATQSIRSPTASDPYGARPCGIRRARFMLNPKGLGRARHAELEQVTSPMGRWACQIHRFFRARQRCQSRRVPLR